MYTLEDLERANTELREKTDRFDRYTGNNPDKYQSEIKAARRRVRHIESDLKEGGLISNTETEQLQAPLRRSLSKANTKKWWLRMPHGVGRPILLSLSKTIETRKNAYYNALKEAQQSLEITPWIHYFVSMILEAQTEAGEQIDFTLKKTKFFARFSISSTIASVASSAGCWRKVSKVLRVG